MTLYEKLNLALERCGYPVLTDPTNFHHAGQGAWHEAYWVQPPNTEPLVVRLRKSIIYGRPEAWSARELHEDYAPVGLYYAEANRCHPGICPAIYHYHIDPDLTFTLESYMPGEPLPLSQLTEGEAVEIGTTLGTFFRTMHQRPAPLPGNGLVTWDEANGTLCAASHQPWAEVWQERCAAVVQQADRLTREVPHVDGASLRQKAANALQSYDHTSHPAVLVNRDITPENILVTDDSMVYIVDPVPLLESGPFLAAHFLHCYRLFLPAVSDSPRYAHNQFRRHAPVLAAVADGYERGYSKGDIALQRALHGYEFLHALDLAHTCCGLLAGALTQEAAIRWGDKQNIARILAASLQALD